MLSIAPSFGSPRSGEQLTFSRGNPASAAFHNTGGHIAWSGLLLQRVPVLLVRIQDRLLALFHADRSNDYELGLVARLTMRKGTLCLALLLLAGAAFGSGHGPVFGFATPTNAKGGWSLDTGFMGRLGSQTTGSMGRAMLAYGITQDLQISISGPAIFQSTGVAPARVTGMMPTSPDFETLGAWRFHRNGSAVGTRFESTAYAGLLLPGPQRPPGMLGTLRRAPGYFTGAVTGMASRAHYVWVGAGNTHYIDRAGDQRPNVFTYSFVYGYRPKSLRKDYPHWDWRGFLEMTGDVSTKARKSSIAMPGTDGHQIFLGPSVLGIYKNYAIEAGLQFPVYRDVGSFFQRERARFAVNFSHLF